MECIVENRPIDCEALYIRGLNYGQDNHKLLVVNYSITVSLEVLAEALSEYYDDFAKDDLIYGSNEEEEAVVMALRNKKWIPLSDMSISYPTLVRDFVELVGYDAIVSLLPPDVDDRNVRYIINSVDEVQLNEGKVKFLGKALELPDRSK